MIKEEPSTWNCVVEPTENQFVVTVSPFIRPFRGVHDVDDYMERLLAEISPQPLATVPSHFSALALPEAIDYLNAVWRSQVGQPLFRLRRVEVAARLVFECNSSGEFAAQLSGLCQILDSLQLPDKAGSKLVDLDTYLSSRLDTTAAARTTDAISTLLALFTLRVWQQHATDDRDWRRAAQRLHVTLPTSDWRSAWRSIHNAAVGAITAIRQELDGLSAQNGA